MKTDNVRAGMSMALAEPPNRMRMWLVSLGFLLLALLLGLSGAVLGWELQLVALSLIVPVVVLVADYRLGLAMMILVVPIATSPLLPKVGPLNALNLLILGIVLVFIAQRILLTLRSARTQVPIPRILVWAYLVPVTLATAWGYTHLDELTPYFLRQNGYDSFGFKPYVIGIYLKNLLLVVNALIIATSVIERGNARFILVATCVSPLVFIACMIAIMADASFSMEDLRTSRSFLAMLGRHANEAGVLLMLQLGPLLFLRESVSSRTVKLLLTIACLMVAGGVLFTVSRGAILGMVAILAYYVLHFRRIRTALAVLTVTVVGFALAPTALQERVLMGTDEVEGGVSSITGRDSHLTSGRVGIWLGLLPEVQKSPLIGRGMLSTSWSDFTKSGEWSANQPHNMYLEILMDMGVIGVICMFIFYRWLWRMFRDLSRDERLDKPVRGYFAGALAMMVGHFTFGISNGHYYPASEQLYLWVAIGLAIGYTQVVQRLPPRPQAAPAVAKPGTRMRGRGHAMRSS